MSAYNRLIFVNDSLLARSMSLHHGLTDLRGNHLTSDMMYSSMVLGNLTSQLEILSTGQFTIKPPCFLCTSGPGPFGMRGVAFCRVAQLHVERRRQ